MNQPNGKVEATITGAMNGLNPNTVYTVFLSNGYTPYAFTGWDLTGSYHVMYAVDGGSQNPALYDMTLTGAGGTMLVSGNFQITN